MANDTSLDLTKRMPESACISNISVRTVDKLYRLLLNEEALNPPPLWRTCEKTHLTTT